MSAVWRLEFSVGSYIFWKICGLPNYTRKTDTAGFRILTLHDAALLLSLEAAAACQYVSLHLAHSNGRLQPCTVRTH